MTEEQLLELINIIQFSFANKLDDEQVAYWCEYLNSQSPLVCKKVLTWYKIESGATFIPSISEFSSKIRKEQVRISMAEARRVDSSKCTECNGLTWSLGDPSGCIPCSACRPSTYARWSEGLYDTAVPPNQDELEGPSDSYQIAARDNHYTGTPVDGTRALQWATHIKAMTTLSPVYPEGFIEESLLESDEQAPTALPQTQTVYVDEMEDF